MIYALRLKKRIGVNGISLFLNWKHLTKMQYNYSLIGNNVFALWQGLIGFVDMYYVCLVFIIFTDNILFDLVFF